MRERWEIIAELSDGARLPSSCHDCGWNGYDDDYQLHDVHPCYRCGRIPLSIWNGTCFPCGVTCRVCPACGSKFIGWGMTVSFAAAKDALEEAAGVSPRIWLPWRMADVRRPDLPRTVVYSALG